MSDLFFYWNQWNFLEIWLLVMALFFSYGLWLLRKMKHKITGSREALEDLRSWGKNHPEFNAAKYSREANAPSDSSLNSRTQRWLKLLWSGYCQNKPPIGDEVVQREEEYLCSDDERIRSTSSSLIILGLLGTFFGLYQVILPIKSIIQNTRDNATITDPSAATQGMTDMLENIGHSFSGMELAFVTSIVGLIGMILLNIRFSHFSKKRFELIDEIETYCSEEIAPKFSLFLPEVDLKEAVQEAFQVLADKHSEFMEDQSDYLKTALEAHFEQVSASFEPFLETLNNTSDMLNKASASSEQVSEQWGSTLEDFSHKHSEFMEGQSDYLKTALEAHFEQVSASFEPFLETLNNTSDMLNKASASNEQVSEQWGNTLEDFSHRHLAFMGDQADHLKTALEAHFENISASLEPLLKTLNNACHALNLGADDIRESSENFVEHISNFTRLSEPLENLKSAVEKMVKDFDDRMNTLALTMGETYQVLQKLNPDEPTYTPVFDNIKAQLDAIHATGQAILKFYQVSGAQDETGLDEKVDPLTETIHATEKVLMGVSRDQVSDNQDKEGLVEKADPLPPSPYMSDGKIIKPNTDDIPVKPNIDDPLKEPKTDDPQGFINKVKSFLKR